jgi:glutathione S-transferase
MKLFYSPGACSLGSHIALEEAGVPYDVEEVAVHRGETQSERYLRINPHGRVPALAVDDAIILENPAIMTFVARQFAPSELLPPNPLAEARCFQFMAWIASTVHPTFAHIVKPERFTSDPEMHEALRETARRIYWAQMCEIDKLIGKRPWVMGERFTICDGNLLPFWGFARRIRLPMEEVANFTNWKDRMISRPAVLRVLEKENSLLLKGREGQR